MNAMLDLCSMASMDSSLLSAALAASYYHLQGDPRSLFAQDMVPSAAPNYALAVSSLIAMTKLIDGQHLSTEVVSGIENEWPSIWSWVSFIVEQEIEMVRAEENEGQTMDPGHLQGVIGSLLSALTAEDRLCGFMASSPDVVSTVTRLIFRAAQAHHPSQTSFFQIFLRLLVKSAMSLETTAIEGLMQQAVETYGVRPSDVALLMLNPVNEELNKPRIACASLLGSLVCMSGCTRKSTAFSQGFISQRSVASVARVFSRLTSNKRPFDRHLLSFAGAVACLKVGGQYLQESFEFGGISCIIEAVEGHLLTSILKAHHFVAYELEHPVRFPQASLEAILIDLLKTVGSYTVYYSVLRAVEKSLGRIEEHSTEQHLVKLSPLHTSWQTFKKMVDPRRWNMGYYADDGVNICNSSSVGENPNGNPPFCFLNFELKITFSAQLLPRQQLCGGVAAAVSLFIAPRHAKRATGRVIKVLATGLFVTVVVRMILIVLAHFTHAILFQWATRAYWTLVTAHS